MEAVDPDEDDEIGGYGIAGGVDGGLFAVVEETGELQFREAPDYEDPADVESAEPAERSSRQRIHRGGRGDGAEKERGSGRGSRAIRVRVTDEEEPPEITSAWSV